GLLGDPTARGLPRPRVARTQERQQATPFPSLSFTPLNLQGQLPDCPSVRATFSPAQPRARRDALFSQASTFLSCAFCEQEGHLAAPLSRPLTDVPSPWLSFTTSFP